MKRSWRFGLLGERIGYSKSPDIFAAIARDSGQEIMFDLFDIAQSGLADFLSSAPQRGLDGLAVTIPHKEAVTPHLDEVEKTAVMIESVNSIKVESDRLIGFNTDWLGLNATLVTADLLGPERRVLLLGAGGAARATVASLAHTLELRELVVIGRSRINLDRMQRLAVAFGVPSAMAVTLDAAGEITGRFDIVVNCTPLGGWNHPDESPLPEGFGWDRMNAYVDLNYNAENQAMAEARRAKVVTVDGSIMLVSQAVESFRLWTGKSASVPAVYEGVFGKWPY